MLKILALYAANAPLNEIRATIVTACPSPPPTTELVLETKDRVTLSDNTYAFRSRAAIDQRFFLDVISFTVLDDVEASYSSSSLRAPI